MKKTSIEMFLLLSDVYGKKQLSDFVTDAKSLEADQLETVLSRLDDQKTQTLSVVVDAIGAELEKKKQITGTADEVLHLLLTSYKLRSPWPPNGFPSSWRYRGINHNWLASRPNPILQNG
jgi:hypothetical protein